LTVQKIYTGGKLNIAFFNIAKILRPKPFYYHFCSFILTGRIM
jgi:hypothetical protein